MRTLVPVPIGKTNDLREMLLSAGVGQFNVAMSVPYMGMLPSTTDPYAQGVSQLVAGLQRLLNQRGAQLAVDGGVGTLTAQAIMRFSGPRWFDKSWEQIYKDVMAGEIWPGWIRNDRSATQNGLSGITGMVGGLGDDTTTTTTTTQVVDASGNVYTVGSGSSAPAAPAPTPAPSGILGMVTSPPGIAAIALAAAVLFWPKKK